MQTSLVPPPHWGGRLPRNQGPEGPRHGQNRHFFLQNPRGQNPSGLALQQWIFFVKIQRNRVFRLIPFFWKGVHFFQNWLGENLAGLHLQRRIFL